jgi:hemolysin activation/secretion protein
MFDTCRKWCRAAGWSLSSWGMVYGFASTPVQAQTVLRAPDAGTLQQQIERDKLSPLPSAKSLSHDRSLADEAPGKGQALVPVRRFLFEGNTLLSSEELTFRLNDLASQSLNFYQLQQAPRRVMQTYREAGWLAYAFLPEQDVTEGSVRVRVVEASMGELVLRQDPHARIDESEVLHIFRAHQRQGQLMDVRALDRALLLVSDLPGVTAQGSLSEARADLSARDVWVDVRSTALVSGDLSADNAGTRSTGRERALVNLKLNSPLGKGDQSTFTAMQSEGSTYLRAETSWPVGYRGWRMSLYDAHLSYRIVSPEFLATNAQGTANTLGLSAHYPWLRAPTKNVYASFHLERKGFDNQAHGATESRYHSSVIGVSLSGNLNHVLNGESNGSVGWVRGQLNLNGSPTQSPDAAGAQTAGRFDKLRYTLSHQHIISSRLTGYAAMKGQWASKNLDSSEKFILGGESGVRAYPSGEGAGAQGQVAHLELRWRATTTATLAGFYDWGRITLLKDKASATALNAYALRGAGLSWTENLPGGASVRLSWARRVGANPNPSSTGTDQDGSLLQNRYGLAASVPFSF